MSVIYCYPRSSLREISNAFAPLRSRVIVYESAMSSHIYSYSFLSARINGTISSSFIISNSDETLNYICSCARHGILIRIERREEILLTPTSSKKLAVGNGKVMKECINELTLLTVTIIIIHTKWIKMAKVERILREYIKGFAEINLQIL